MHRAFHSPPPCSSPSCNDTQSVALPSQGTSSRSVGPRVSCPSFPRFIALSSKDVRGCGIEPIPLTPGQPHERYRLPSHPTFCEIASAEARLSDQRPRLTRFAFLVWRFHDAGSGQLLGSPLLVVQSIFSRQCSSAHGADMTRHGDFWSRGSSCNSKFIHWLPCLRSTARRCRPFNPTPNDAGKGQAPVVAS